MLHDIEGNTIETIDERNERLADDTLDCAGVCKDCGNGTLNNNLNPAFEEYGDDCGGDPVLVCNRCGSTHLDIL